MKDNVVPPMIGLMPREYDSHAINRALRIIELQLAQITEVGPVRVSTINISNLPTSATGLRTGDLWNDAGTVKIV